MFSLEQLQIIKNACQHYQQQLLVQIDFNQKLFDELTGINGQIEAKLPELKV